MSSTPLKDEIQFKLKRRYIQTLAMKRLHYSVHWGICKIIFWKSLKTIKQLILKVLFSTKMNFKITYHICKIIEYHTLFECFGQNPRWSSDIHTVVSRPGNLA